MKIIPYVHNGNLRHLLDNAVAAEEMGLEPVQQ